jgi:aminoglycoside 6-adenylyltransferase
MKIDQTTQAYEQLIQRFAKWAQTKQDIRAAFIIGSRARADHPADEWSDLDIVIAATDSQPYLSIASWVESIGKPWLTFIEPTADGRGMERRVLFEGGLDVDFAFIPVNLIQQMAQAGIPSDVTDTLRCGVRVILDKDDLLKQLQVAPVESPPLQLPPQSEFLETINDFWYHAVWTAKHLRRGELWWAKAGCDNYMKRLLLRMIEWHARATRGPDYDTWLRGAFWKSGLPPAP